MEITNIEVKGFSDVSEDGVVNVDLNYTVEQAAKEVVQQERVNPLDQAADLFKNNLPRIRALSRNMGRNGLARVFAAVAEFPLSDEYPKFGDKTEQELFILTLATIDAKNMMLHSFSQDMKQEIHHEATNKIVKEVLEKNTSTKTEENNG